MKPFEEMVALEGPVVWRVCRALLNTHDAEDAWAETFLAALRAYPTLAPDSNVRGWLVTIAHRKAIDQLRSARRRPQPLAQTPETFEQSPPSETGFESPTLPGSDHPDLLTAVAALPTKQRHAVVYRYVGDLAYVTIAELLGSTEAAARRSAADGIARLRRTVTPAAAAPATSAASPSKQEYRS